MILGWMTICFLASLSAGINFLETPDLGDVKYLWHETLTCVLGIWKRLLGVYSMFIDGI